MFNTEKLSKLLKEIFTRDNGNFSPELVAEELTRRENDFMVKPTVYRYNYSDPTSGQQQFKAESDPREMKCTHTLSRNEREKFHYEAVAWLSETYLAWPAGDAPGCRDWVFVNKNSAGEWFMPVGIFGNDGCVVWKSEWSAGRTKLGVVKGCNKNDPSTCGPDAMRQTLGDHVEWPWREDRVLLRNIDGVWRRALATMGVSIQDPDGSHSICSDGVIITKQDFIDARVAAPSPRCIVIGNFSQCTHNNSVVIGNNQKSDKPNQLKIGNNDISVSRDITDEEFQEILATFKSVREALPK